MSDISHSTDSAARYLGVSPSYLNQLRCRKDGPRYVRLGRRVTYPESFLNEWKAQKVCNPREDAANAVA